MRDKFPKQKELFLLDFTGRVIFTTNTRVMIKYRKEKLEHLKFKFQGIEKIEENFSQAYQDMFVLSILDGKEKGYFLEIGAFDGAFLSNTYLLEKSFGWNGIALDIKESAKISFEAHRRTSKMIVGDALTLDYSSLLKENDAPKIIDYLQLDIEPQANTLECLKRIPFDEYQFRVITYETDYYDTSSSREESHRILTESREILKSNGYELVVGNVCNISKEDPFEDWYIKPELVDLEILKIFRSSDFYNNTSETYMFL